MSAWFVELLPNGYVSIRHRASGLQGLFNQDGTHHSGDYRLGQEAVLRIFEKHADLHELAIERFESGDSDEA